MFEPTKFTKKVGLSMVLIAKLASDGIFGLFFMIRIETSFIESMIALYSSSSSMGRASFNSSIFALK